MENLTNQILIIDDDPDNLEVLADLIQHAFPGYRTLTASSGLKGLELAVSANPDVILLDMLMPGMNGFEVCRKLKSDPKNSRIPVVFLTAKKGDRERRQQAIEAGAEAFLYKPVDESELIVQIRAMQKIKKSTALLRDEKDNLTRLVMTQPETLQQTHTATLNLLEDLHDENDARKKNEEALRDSEDKFRYLFDYSVAPKSVTQLSGTMQVNQAFCDMLGYSREELERFTWQELTHPDDVEMNQNAINSLLNGVQVSVRLTKRYIHKNGSIVWVDLGTALRRDKNGQPLYLISTFTDITERKQAEDALRESEERFRTLIEKAPVGIYISRDGIGLYANQKDLQIFGLSSVEEITGRPVTDFLAPQSKKDSRARTSRHAQGLPTPVEFETIGLRPDGTQIPVQVTVDSVQLSDGPANMSFITDITERKQAQALEQAVYQIAAAAETTASLEDLYPQIHESIASVMPAENFYIALYDEAEDLLRFPYFKDPKDESYVNGVHPGKGTTAYVLRTGKSLLATEQVHAELERQGELVLLGVPSAIWLGVPLIVDGITIGAMVVQHFSDPKAYGEREQHMLEFVSSQVAVAINRKQAEEALRTSEQRFRDITAFAGEWIWEVDAAGKYTYSSPLVERLLGYTPEEALHLHFYDLFHPDERDALKSAALAAFAAKQPISEFINRNIHKNGQTVWLSTSGLPLLDSQGNLLGYRGVDIDITARKLAEALQQAVYQISAAAETTASLDELYPRIHQSISSVMAAENFYIALYDEAQNLLQFPYYRDIVDTPFATSIEPGQGMTAYVLRTGKSLLGTLEKRYELESQGDVQVQGTPSAIWLGVPLNVEGKTIGAMVVQHYSDPQAYGECDQQILEFVSGQVAIAIDRKQSEAALRASETRYRGLFEHSPVAIWEEDFSAVKRHLEELRQSGVADFRAFFTSHPQELGVCFAGIKVLDVNAATLAMIHAASKEQLKGNLHQVVPIEPGMDFLDELVNIAEGKTEFAWDGVNYTLDGKKLFVRLHWSAAPGYEDTLEKVLVSLMDITARKQAEQALRESEERFRKVFEEGPLGMAIANFTGDTFISVNAALCRMLGYTEEELKLHNFVDLTHPDDRDQDQQAARDLLGGRIQIHNAEKRYLKKNGEVIWASRALTRIASADSQSYYALAMIEDITARKLAEDQIRQLNASLEQCVNERTRELHDAQEQLVRQEKLATLGQLAGGVGHELRNPLGVINSAVYYLKLVQPDADEKTRKYHLMIEQEVHTASQIINDLLDFGRVITTDCQPVSIPELLQRVLTRFPVPTSVRMKLKLSPSLPMVFADPLHLEQVLGNLTANACQAMKDCEDGGKLTISASVKKGQVAIAIKDTGTGITPAAMQKLFEPLFTTKLRGIGLGLAVSKKLAEANGGHITVQSQPGQGSTFTLYLPVKGSQVEQEA